MSTIKRGKVYYSRLYVPSKLHQALQKREVVKSLRTSSYKVYNKMFGNYILLHDFFGSDKLSIMKNLGSFVATSEKKQTQSKGYL